MSELDLQILNIPISESAFQFSLKSEPIFIRTDSNY